MIKPIQLLISNFDYNDNEIKNIWYGFAIALP